MTPHLLELNNVGGTYIYEMARGRRIYLEKKIALKLQSYRKKLTALSQLHLRLFKMVGLVIVVCLAGLGGWLVARHSISENETVKEDLRPEKDVTRPDVRTVEALLRISSDPACADIYIDNQFKGRTPADVRVPSGIMELRLRQPNYYDWAANIEIRDKFLPLHVTLRPIPKKN